MVVNVPAEAVLPPITLLSIVPFEMVRSSATELSAISVPSQTPEEIVPTASITLSFSVVITVPVTSGKVIMRSVVGSTRDNVV